MSNISSTCFPVSRKGQKPPWTVQQCVNPTVVELAVGCSGAPGVGICGPFGQAECNPSTQQGDGILGVVAGALDNACFMPYSPAVATWSLA